MGNWISDPKDWEHASVQGGPIDLLRAYGDELSPEARTSKLQQFLRDNRSGERALVMSEMIENYNNVFAVVDWELT